LEKEFKASALYPSPKELGFTAPMIKIKMIGKKPKEKDSLTTIEPLPKRVEKWLLKETFGIGNVRTKPKAKRLSKAL
jgi:hypothetical protein